MLEINQVSERTLGEVRCAYERIYREQGIRQIDSFYLRLLKRLKMQKGRLLLDVACGQGVLPQIAAGQGLQAFGTDFCMQAMERASILNPPFFTVADGEALPYPDDCFDYVTSIGSLEHYLCPERGALEICRVLKPDGQALVLLPNTFSLLHNVWTALRSGRTGADQQPIQRYATLREWQDLLEDSGLQVVRVFKYEKEFPCSFRDLVWYLRHPRELLRMMLTPLIPLSWAFAFVYLCSKKDSAAGIRKQSHPVCTGRMG